MSTRPPPQPRPDSRNFTPQPGRCFDVNAAELCWCLDWSRDWPRGWREGTDHHPDCKWDTGTTCTRPDLGRWDNFHARNCGEECDPWPGVKVPWTRTPEGGMRWPAVGEPEPCRPAPPRSDPMGWLLAEPVRLPPPVARCVPPGEGQAECHPAARFYRWHPGVTGDDGRAVWWVGGETWRGVERPHVPGGHYQAVALWVHDDGARRWWRGDDCSPTGDHRAGCARFSQRNGYGPAAPHPCRPPSLHAVAWRRACVPEGHEAEGCACGATRVRQAGAVTWGRWWTERGLAPTCRTCSPVQAEQGSRAEQSCPPVRSAGSGRGASASGDTFTKDTKDMKRLTTTVRRRGHNAPCARGPENAVRRALTTDRVPGVCAQANGPAFLAPLAPASEELRREVRELGEELPTWADLAVAVSAIGAALGALLACFRPGWRVLRLCPEWRVRLGAPLGVAGGRVEGVALERREVRHGERWVPVLILATDTWGKVGPGSAWDISSAWAASGVGLRELGEVIAAALEDAHAEAGPCWGCPIACGDEGPCGGCRDQAAALGRARFGVEYAPRCQGQGKVEL